jgi:hypothetical protein
VCGGAGAAGFEGAAGRVGDVVFVVGAVEVFAVPASWGGVSAVWVVGDDLRGECDGGADAAAACGLG